MNTYFITIFYTDDSRDNVSRRARTYAELRQKVLSESRVRSFKVNMIQTPDGKPTDSPKNPAEYDNPRDVIPMDEMTRLDLVNENAYLRIALIQAARALENMKDNLEAGRVSIVILDDGEPHPGNMDAGIEALKYASDCIDRTRHI